MPHPMLPHPEGLPPERDDRDIAVLYIVRDGKQWPDPFPPDQVKDPSFFTKYGGGKYQIVARGSSGYVTARSQLFEIEGPPVPYVSPNSPAGPTPASAPSNSTMGVQVFTAVLGGVGALAPVFIEMFRGNREEQRYEREREREEKREAREREEKREERREQQRREDRERELLQRREDAQREEARHRESIQMMREAAQNQLAVQATFAERLQAVSNSGGSGSFKKDVFFDGVEFAKGMMENNGMNQMMAQVPSLIMALKGGGPPAMAPGAASRGFVGGPTFFNAPGPSAPVGGPPPGPFAPPQGPAR